MVSKEVEEFARLVVQKVRDQAIAENDRILRETHSTAKRWRESANRSLEEYTRTVVCDVVDSTVFFLLKAIDNGDIRVSFEASNGLSTKLWDNGELAGWYAMDDGWPSAFSSERVPRRFEDLNLPQ
jgi:hypothetical protein